MNIRWRIYRHPEVIKYLVGLHKDGAEIRFAIDQLAEKGIPSNAEPTEKPNQWIFVEAQHYITVGIFENEHAIYVTNVEHVEDVAKRIS